MTNIPENPGKASASEREPEGLQIHEQIGFLCSPSLVPLGPSSPENWANQKANSPRSLKALDAAGLDVLHRVAGYLEAPQGFLVWFYFWSTLAQLILRDIISLNKQTYFWPCKPCQGKSNWIKMSSSDNQLCISFNTGQISTVTLFSRPYKWRTTLAFAKFSTWRSIKMLGWPWHHTWQGQWTVVPMDFLLPGVRQTIGQHLLAQTP